MTAQALADSRSPTALAMVPAVVGALPSWAPPDLNASAVTWWLRNLVRWRWADPDRWVSLDQLLSEGSGNCRAISTALAALLIAAGYGEALSWGVGFAEDMSSHVWVIFWGQDGPQHLDASTWRVVPGDSPVDAAASPLIASYSFPL